MQNEKLEKINAELKQIMLEKVHKLGTFQTTIPGLSLSRREQGNCEGASIYSTSLGFIVDGQKRSVIGDREYEYGKNNCLVVGVDVPASFCTIGATHDHPFLSISVEIDRAVLSELIMQLEEIHGLLEQVPNEALCVGEVDEKVWEAVLRLMRLLDNPVEAKVLAPMIIREIYFRVLQSPLGMSLREFNAKQGASAQIARAIAWLRENYALPLSVAQLADNVHMGVSTFHRHFKEVTCMTPLQFHKRLRLHEAKRLMLTQKMDATTACYAVGYESPSQFNREYKRQFGLPPYRDIKQQRELVRGAPETVLQ